MVPPNIAAAAEVIASAQRLVVLTGAGISTDSGIPDFRGPNGVWTRNPAAEKASNIHYYLTDPEVRRAAWRQRLDTAVWTAEPNLGHHCIVDLQRSGRLAAVITQNIDGLHQESGIDPDLVIEVHGTMRDTRCLDCGDVRSMQEALDRVRAGEADPPCRRCGGIMKADTISFGQALIPEVIDRAFQMAQTCDVLLAVGSSLSVSPINQVVPTASRHGAKVIIVNGERTEMDAWAHHVVRGSIADVLPVLVGRRPR